MNDNQALEKASTIQDTENWALELSKSDLCPTHLKGKPKDIIYTIQLGNELNIPAVIAINQIYVIGDKPTLGGHLYKALALKGGVTWEILKNSVPIYKYSDSVNNSYNYEDIKNDDLYQIFPFSLTNLPNNFKEQIAPKYADKILVFKSAKPIDYVTSIKFKRLYNGVPMELIQEFKYTDAVTAGLAGESGVNPNWQKRPKHMMLIRCFTDGIKNIAPDTVMGMYHKDEILDQTNKDFEIDIPISVEDAN